MTAFGASKELWQHLADAGLAADLLPVVCDPSVPISRNSKLQSLGKVPSAIDSQGMAHGIRGWTSKFATADEIATWSNDDRLGICLQTRIYKVFDVDVEEKALADLVKGLLIPMIAQMAGVSPSSVPLRFRQNSNKFALIVRCDAVMPKRVIAMRGSNRIEFLGNGQQAMIAGMHPSGSQVQLEVIPTEAPNLTPEQINLIWQRLQEEFGTTSSTSKKPAEDFTAGFEPKLDLSVDKMKELLSLLDPDCSREEWLRVGLALHHETSGDDTGLSLWDEWSSRGDKYPGYERLQYEWERFRGAVPGQHSVTMASVMWMAKNADVPSEGQWPQPRPLPDTLLPVPELAADMLPEELSPWLADIAGRMSLPLDFVAIPAMVMLGALIGRKVLVRPEEHTDWGEPANLWGAIVSPPGAMKSPAVSQVFAPMKLLEKEAQLENKQASERFELELLVKKTARDAALAGVKKNSAPSSPADIEQALMDLAMEPPKPKMRRFMTTDATVEKLGEICADNPHGILFHRDELPTLFLDLQREEKATARGFLLTGWAGLEAYTFDRIARGTTYVEAVNISLFGTAQPRRIANLVAVSSGRHDDGMIQRLQLLAWPDLQVDWVPVDRPPDQAARDAALACCRRLAGLSGVAVAGEVEGSETPPFLRLDDDARRAFQDYRTGLECQVRSRTLPEALAAHLSKYRGLVPRLALILHLAGGGTGRVTEKAMRNAIRWAYYLEAHARRMYASVDIVTSDTARLILRRIQNGELRDGFTQRDITQKGWSGLRDAEEVKRGLSSLTEHGWLKAAKITTQGRPREIFRINPAALSQVS